MPNAYANYMRSFKHYMNDALFNPKWGYYGSGQVDFINDYQTHAEEFGALLAERCFKTWQAMVNNKEIDKDTPFHIYEFGAGTGALALRFLMYSQGMSVRFPATEWANFFKAIKYVIGEISPALAKKQTALLQKYINGDKVAIHNVDAKEVKDNFPTGAGIVLSNELIDAFPVQKIQINYNASTSELTAKVMCVAATIPEEVLIAMLEKTEAALKKQEATLGKQETTLKKQCTNISEYKKNIEETQDELFMPKKIKTDLAREKYYLVQYANLATLLNFNHEKYSNLIAKYRGELK
ncbi:MAG: SAM-dependent methyltransferase [Gammaproteobacteria bacterium]